MNRMFIPLTLFLLLSWSARAQTSVSELTRTAGEARAEGHFQRALPLYRQAAEQMGGLRRSQQVSILNGLAACYTELGEYDQALECYEQLDPIYRAGGTENPVNTLNRSNLLLLMGQYGRVADLLRNLRCETEREETVRLVNMAYALHGLGMSNEALALLDTLLQKTPDTQSQNYVTAQNNRGFILLAMNRQEEAAAALRLAVDAQPADRADRYRSQSNLAVAEASLPLIDECMDWFAHHYGTSHPDYALCLRKKAEILLRQQQPQTALPLLKQYFNLRRQYILHHFLCMGTQQRLNFWAAERELLNLCYATEGLDPDFLFDVAVFSKSVMLQSNAVFLQLKSLTGDDQALYEKLETLRRQAAGASGDERERLEREADHAEVALIKRINSDGSYARELQASGSDVRRALKSERDAAMEFVRYRPMSTDYAQEGIRYAALVMTRRHTRFVPLWSQQQLSDYVLPSGRTLAESIASTKRQDKNALFADPQLADFIWKPITKLLPSSAHIYFSAEGLLNTLGIEYLDAPYPQLTFSRLSSTRQLIQGQSTKHKGARTKKEEVLVVGGIDYNDASQSQPTLTLPDRSGSFTFAMDNHLPTSGNRFGYLPGSRAEADSICRLVGRTTHYEGSEATEAVMKREMQRHTQIHVSTHGVAYGLTSNVPTVDVSSPIFSVQSSPQDLSLSRCGIVLAGVNKTSAQTAENSRLEDGILTAREVCDLDLSQTELAVLSACQTGLGNAQADGLVGLPQGLKRAGCGAVVVSLWPVDDKATQLLMSYFYEALEKKQHTTPEQALREARERLRTTVLPEQRTVRWFDPGTLTNKVRMVDDVRTFDQPYYYNAFIVFDGK